MILQNKAAPIRGDQGRGERSALATPCDPTTKESNRVEGGVRFASEACKHAFARRDFAEARVWMRVITDIHNARSPRQVAHLEEQRGLR